MDGRRSSRLSKSELQFYTLGGTKWRSGFNSFFGQDLTYNFLYT